MKKSAGIIIRNRHLLVLRSHGNDTFYAPGGKPGQNESAEMALIRELKEEISIDVIAADLHHYGTYKAPAAGNESKLLQMDVFVVDDYAGEICASNEIAEIKWVNSENIDRVKVSSIFRDNVFPRLREQALLD